jgi:hypothetical protein
MQDKRKLIIGVIALLLAVLIGGIFAFTGGNDADTADTAPNAPGDGSEEMTGTMTMSYTSGKAGATVTISVKDIPLHADAAIAFSDGSLSEPITMAGDGTGSTQKLFEGDPRRITVTVHVETREGGKYTLTPGFYTAGTNGNFQKTDSTTGLSGRVEELVGEPGTSLTITATVAGETGSAVFTFTKAAEPEEKIAVSISPDEGKSGTPATITVVGAPNQPVTIRINGDKINSELINNGMTDEDGKFVQTHTFEGVVGEASIEGGPHTFISLISVKADPSEHEQFVALEELMELDVTIHGITIEGEAPFVGVTGDLNEDGTFRVEGRGTVAGIPDVSVVFEGLLQGTTLTGDYTMGANGELPGGDPITYYIEGELELAAATDEPDFAAFYERFNNAQAAAGSTVLFDSLNPAVISRYGSEGCSTYLATIVNPQVVVEFVSATGPERWSYETDETCMSSDNTYAVQVELRVGDGDPTPQETHLAVLDGGQITWFTECGAVISG